MGFQSILAGTCACLTSLIVCNSVNFDIVKNEQLGEQEASKQRYLTTENLRLKATIARRGIKLSFERGDRFRSNRLRTHQSKSRNQYFLKSTVNNISLSKAELETYDSVVQYAIDRQLYLQPMGEAVQHLAEYFLDIPYSGYQLDQSSEEQLLVTFQSFDCVIFVETIVALARAFSQQNYLLDTVIDNIREQRYRNGKIDGYCSRLHYFTDWIEDNQRRGIVTDITPQLNGISLQKDIDFMTTHREAYPQLIANEANYQCIAEQEGDLSPLDLTYIPTDEIPTIYSELRSGDIIAIATSTPGLDVSHTSFVRISDNGGVGIVHSDVYGVKTEPDLQAFVGSANNAIGIIVARPNNLRE